MRCRGETKGGGQCKKKAPDGEYFCWQHAAQADDVPAEAGLTLKQRQFVNEYMIDFNGSAAARRAGYSGSSVTIRSTSYELRNHPLVREAIEARMAEAGMGAAEAVARMTSWARGTIAHFIADYTEDGRPIFDLSTEEARAHIHLVKSVKYDKRGNMVLELHDPKDAVTTIMKTHGLFRESLDISVVDARAERIRENLDRLDEASDEELAEMTRLLTEE